MENEIIKTVLFTAAECQDRKRLIPSRGKTLNLGERDE